MQFAKSAWLRALESTAAIERTPTGTLPALIQDLALQFEAAPALIATDVSFTYRELADACNRYTRWGSAQGLRAGDVVCLLMLNSPHYMAIWLGLTRIGVTVSLLNTQLRGPALSHSINIVAPRHVLVDARLCDAVPDVLEAVGADIQWWAHGAGGLNLPRLDIEAAAFPATQVSAEEIPLPHLQDRALFIYTSGTTGLPKAANVSHYRVMQWSHWFAGMMDTTPQDRMYACLPLYHSVGGIVATGACLVRGGSVLLRERFSARDFWPEITEARCTLFQYIGELCRYLVNTPAQPSETLHSLRLCCGNGMRADVWQEFQQRFRIPRILEYYASTEGNFSLYNCEGKVGAIGRIPPFLRHRLPIAVVKFDVATAMPIRNTTGQCVPCDVDEAGEAIGQLQAAGGAPVSRFEGYADAAATDKKVLRDVFVPGDAWYRTGDLMRQDQQGFFYFVDRVGETYRWKGENVSTEQVTAAITCCPGVITAAVYGVPVPGAEGRAGMAAVVTRPDFDLAQLRRHLVSQLPDYARPLFLRLIGTIEVTETFKLRKNGLVAEGFDPARVPDLYMDDYASKSYLPLDAAMHERLTTGGLRL
jgi:fatty-acyl-CoA synthase